MTDPEVTPGVGRNETEILAGFLLTLPFQSRFEDLDHFQAGLYPTNVVLAALTTALILLPVSVHRRLFRQRLKIREAP
jgi:hypothetical protein